jgi:hypothetical protein
MRGTDPSLMAWRRSISVIASGRRSVFSRRKSAEEDRVRGRLVSTRDQKLCLRDRLFAADLTRLQLVRQHLEHAATGVS